MHNIEKKTCRFLARLFCIVEWLVLTMSHTLARCYYAALSQPMACGDRADAGPMPCCQPLADLGRRDVGPTSCCRSSTVPTNCRRLPTSSRRTIANWEVFHQDGIYARALTAYFFAMKQNVHFLHCALHFLHRRPC